MSLLKRDAPFGASCPSGGSWYSCGTSKKFVGCCRINGCDPDIGCADGNVMPASFDTSYYGKIPNQQCPSVEREWYTCKFTSPPFMGCCSVKPCDSGCPRENLQVAFLSGNPEVAAAFSPSGIPSATVTPTASPSPSSTWSPSPSSTESSTLVGAITGGAAGGGVVVVAIIAGLFFYCRRRSKKRRQEAEKPPLPPVVELPDTERYQVPDGTLAISRDEKLKNTPMTSECLLSSYHL